ncbi:ATP-binding protein [Streptomyces albidoflavus]
MGTEAIELPSRVASLAEVETWGDAVAEACGLGEGDRHRVGLALHEAAANAVLHGNGADPAKRVRLGWARGDGRLLVTVGDEGDGFTRPGTAPGTNLTGSGRGLILIGHLTDGYRVTPRDDPPGTDVVLVFDLSE